MEEAPEGARAFATAMFGLALGAGVALSVIFLPFADLGDYGWRISFLLSAAAVLLVPLIARHLRETRRYSTLVTKAVTRGRIREVFDRAYGGRFVLLGLAAFLANVFAAPSSQLSNRYLTNAHDFSNSDVALFRTVTLGFPGFIGILLAGRLAESRGRRPVTIIGLLVATGFQMAFFLADSSAVLWIAPTIAIVAAACGGPRVGHARRRAVPHRGAQHLERVPAGGGRGRLCHRARARNPAPRQSWVGSVPRSRSVGSPRWSPRSSWCPGSRRPRRATSTTSARPRERGERPSERTAIERAEPDQLQAVE